MKKNLIGKIIWNNARRVSKTKRHAGFTLAEVLITLGIIGVVAAMTLPALVQNYQEKLLKNQFKKTYATFFNGVKQAQANLGYPVSCSYWINGPVCKEACAEKDPIYNTCIRHTCEDGTPLLPQHNGPRSDCTAFEEELFNKVFKTVKFCQNKALANGCITDEYRGTDKIKAENNPNAAFPPNPASDFSDSNIKNNYSSWVLTDGTVIIKYGTYKGSTPVYTVDVNGHKKPNKWGYDIFTFILDGDVANGIIKVRGESYAVEKGGKSTGAMLQEMYK